MPFSLPTAARPRALLAAGCVLVGSAAVQTSAALASSLFATLGTPAVSGYRMTAAALCLLLVVRPALRGRSRRAWAAIVLYGVAMAAMNVLFYAALQRLPLGVAVTLEFLGPLTVAALAAVGRERLLPVATLIGVVLVVGPGGRVDLLGVLLALGAAAAFGGYTLLAGRVGDHASGLDGLALSVAVGAVLLAPFQVAAAPRLTVEALPVLLVSGLIGVAVAFSLDFQAVRLAGARVVGTLFAVDPVMGALVGAVALGDRLSVTAVAGIVAVVTSGATVIWLSGRSRGVTLPTG